jgi:hypothetical protein
LLESALLEDWPVLRRIDGGPDTENLEQPPVAMLTHHFSREGLADASEYEQ